MYSNYRTDNLSLKQPGQYRGADLYLLALERLTTPVCLRLCDRLTASEQSGIYAIQLSIT